MNQMSGNHCSPCCLTGLNIYIGEYDLSIWRSLPSPEVGTLIRLPLAMLSGILVQQVINSQALSLGGRKTG